MIDAKANLNIIGDEAIIEIEETVPVPVPVVVPVSAPEPVPEPVKSCKAKKHHHKK